MSAIETPSSRDRFPNPEQHEIDSLSPVLAAIVAKRSQVLERWWALYALHFADERTLSEREFRESMSAALDALGSYLSEDIKGFEARARNRWSALAERGVSFAEASAILRLFEESALYAVDDLRKNASSYQLLRRHVYRCVPLIVEGYLQAGTPAAWEVPAPRDRKATGTFHGLVGTSAGMRRLYERIEAVGRAGSTALIVGETGTGKELVARAIHECGPRLRIPFVAVNCAAVPGHLIESELFGHMRGAFSGADADTPGLFRAANHGTLFLDEITEMSMAAQAKLLRALQERTVRPVGSTREVSVSVRVIASTNRDPEEATKCGHLRRDLYYRLNVAELHVPPLRERRDDIEALAWHFIRMFNLKLARSIPVTGVSAQAMEAMRSYAWPGNVRELANAIESALTFGRSNSIRLDDLPEAVSGRAVQARGPMSLPETERGLIRHALEAANGNISRAARMLQISRKKLYARMIRYDLTRYPRRPL